MNFRKTVIEHLAQYKLNILDIKEEGKFFYRNKEIIEAHILPKEKQKLNILEQYSESFFSSKYSKIKLHKYFHHLNSSQALCINLFYPLIVENRLDFFIQHICNISENSYHATFEKKSDIEEAERRTSFDFCIELLTTNNKIFVEVKYTEDGFGKAKDDNEHREKFEKTYLHLVNNSRFLAEKCKNVNFFLNNYQILRNLVHISNNDFVIFLFPTANKVIREQAIFTQESFLTDEGKSRFKIIFLEEFVSELINQYKGNPLEIYYNDFITKYLPQQV